MKQALPALYRAYCQSVEHPENRVKSDIGFHDDVWVADFVLDSTEKSVNGLMIASLTDDLLIMDENIFVRSANETVVLDLFKTGTESNHRLTPFTVSCPSNKMDDLYKIDCTVVWVNKQSGILHGLVYSCDMRPLIQRNQLSKEVAIIHPVKKSSGTEAPIRICYNRNWLVNEQIDYSFNEKLNPKTGVQNLYAPLEFTVYFKDELASLDRIMDDMIVKLDSKKGTATYNTNRRPDAVQITAFKGGFSVNFNSDWQTDVPASRLPIRDRVDFYVRLSYMLTNGSVGEVQIDSYDQTIPSANHAKGLWINLLWGCVARGTDVLYADGSSRPIEQVQIGDMISSSVRGDIARVQNVIQGVEAEMINIQIGEGEILSCTATHPVITTKGPKKAIELCGEDILFNRYGEPLPIVGIWNTGECEVFNLILDFMNNDLEQSQGMFCNNILLGDNLMQNTMMYNLCTADATASPFACEQQTKQDIWRKIGGTVL